MNSNSTETIAYAVSRVRGSLKASKEDAFITDRYIYSLILKYAKTFIKRQDTLDSLLRFNSLFVALPCVELIEVDKIEACCNIKSNCKIMRTKEKIPKPLESLNGLLIRTVSSIDGSTEVYMTEPGTYTSMTKTSTHKYDKSKYYWYLNGYLYFPNIEWESIKIEGVFEDDISNFDCNSGDCDECTKRQDQKMSIPADLLSEIEQQVRAEILPQSQLPPDVQDDKQSVWR